MSKNNKKRKNASQKAALSEKKENAQQGEPIEAQPIDAENAQEAAEVIVEEPVVAVETEETKETEDAVKPEAKAKRPMSKKKKTILITLSVFLGLILLILGVGTYLFFHYYNMMNIEKLDDPQTTVDAQERVLRLYDAKLNKEFTFTVSIVGLPDEEVLLIDSWFASGNGQLPVSVGKDPAKMTEAERKALYKRVLAAIKKENAAASQTAAQDEVTILNVKTGKQWTIVINKMLEDVSDADYGIITLAAARQKTEGGYLEICFDGDPTQKKGKDLASLYAMIATAYRNSIKDKVTITLVDAETEKSATLRIYMDELSEEQSTKLAKFNLLGISVSLSQLPEYPDFLDADAREALLSRVFAFIEESLVVEVYYTVQLRDPASETVYTFKISKKELTVDQLGSINKLQGVLDMALESDPNLLSESERAALIEAIVEAIENIDNTETVYQIVLCDRATNTKYVLSYLASEVSAEQFALLRSVEGEVRISISQNPEAMSKEEKSALIAQIVEEIEYPSSALSIVDPSTKKTYTLYFCEKDATGNQYLYLLNLIKENVVVEFAVSKDPLTMTAAEKQALINAIYDKLTAPVVQEYKMNLRDPESGKFYVLVFTAEEVNSDAIFGYLYKQSQSGATLTVEVTKDPAEMTAEERQALFAVAAEAIRNPTGGPNDPEALEKLKEHLQNLAQNPVQHTADIYNVLLVGTDERNEDDNTKAKNSDTMILATVNYKDGTITLTSLMRDTCVKYTYMSGGKERENTAKLNTAYAVGGMKTLISAIETNYGVTIDNYIRVNWFSFIDIFKVLGGVDVTVNAKHLDTLNKVIKDNCFIFSEDYEKNKLTAGGYQHLNALQALAYVRYRVSDADFGRTARQREVLSIVFNKFKSSSLTTINDILNTVLPMITTDLTAGNCAALLLKFPAVKDYKLQQQRLPEWEEYTNYNDMLVPDWEKTLKRLYRTAYGSLCPEQYK